MNPVECMAIGFIAGICLGLLMAVVWTGLQSPNVPPATRQTPSERFNDRS